MFFFEKDGLVDKSEHQKEIIKALKSEMEDLFVESTRNGYHSLEEQRTFKNQFPEEVEALILNDIRIGEADRARIEEATSEEPNFYRMAFNEIRLRIANEGRAENKNNIDDLF